MSLLLETVGFFLSTVGWALLAVTLFNSYWRVSSVSGNVITTSTIFENLWQSCATDSTGVYNCWEFQSLLELPAYLQASRALMITALVLGFLAIVTSMLGLQCTKVAENNPNAKAKLAVIGGSLFVLAGLCGMVTVSWYAFNITRDFFNPLFVGTKYEIGPALYLGWSASLLVIIGGCFLFSSCRNNSSQDNSYTYPYKAPKGGTSAHNPSISRPCRESNASSNGLSSTRPMGRIRPATWSYPAYGTILENLRGRVTSAQSTQCKEATSGQHGFGPVYPVRRGNMFSSLGSGSKLTTPTQLATPSEWQQAGHTHPVNPPHTHPDQSQL